MRISTETATEEVPTQSFPCGQALPCDHASASIRLVTGTRPARAARAEHAGAPLEQLKVFLETSLKRISGKSSLATAIRYSLSRLKALPRYVTDGRLEMSNNAAEHATKSPVPGRKNYHFCGFDAGGQRAVCFYTILETCRMNGIHPQAYPRSSVAIARDTVDWGTRSARPAAEKLPQGVRLTVAKLISC